MRWLMKRGARLAAPDRGRISVVSQTEVRKLAIWPQCFSAQRKDHRFYELVERTLQQGFEYHYFVFEDAAGQARAVQPFFVVDQDIGVGLGRTATRVIKRLRHWYPRLLKMRTLMVGCVAGEGHLSGTSAAQQAWIADMLKTHLHAHACQLRVSLVVLKEFPSMYRTHLSGLLDHGYVRMPSMPMVSLALDFASFDEYLATRLSKSTRRSLRRKFKKAAAAAPITMAVVTDIEPFIDEAYPLYLQVFERSPMTFEKLSEDYLCAIGKTLADRARFFLWCKNDKLIAFSSGHRAVGDRKRMPDLLQHLAQLRSQVAFQMLIGAARSICQAHARLAQPIVWQIGTVAGTDPP
jgi:predicted N-acyltransferase